MSDPLDTAGAAVPGPAPGPGPAPVTGDDAVDEAVARLQDLTGVPLDGQPAVFDAVHRALQDRLADVEG